MNSVARFNNFDVLRLLAATQVMLGHGINQFSAHGLYWLEDLIEYFPGVPVFFIISGYLIGSAYERRVSNTGFYIDRVRRIYPALYFSLIMSVIIVFVFSLPVVNSEFFVWVFTQMTFMQNYDPEFLSGFGVGKLNPPLWTIAVEIQFYVLVPVIFFLINKLEIKTLVFLFVSLILLKEFNNILHINGGLGSKLFNQSAIPHLYLFVLGVFLSIRKDLVKKYASGKFFHWLGVYSLVVLVSVLVGVETQSNWQSGFVSLSLGMMAISFAFSYVEKLKVFRPKYDLSYGIYIYHYIVINVLVEVGYSGVEGLILMILVTLGVSIISWRYIEEPFIRKKSHRKLAVS